jgi:hypothetical protein
LMYIGSGGVWHGMHDPGFLWRSKWGSQHYYLATGRLSPAFGRQVHFSCWARNGEGTREQSRRQDLDIERWDAVLGDQHMQRCSKAEMNTLFSFICLHVGMKDLLSGIQPGARLVLVATEICHYAAISSVLQVFSTSSTITGPAVCKVLTLPRLGAFPL